MALFSSLYYKQFMDTSRREFISAAAAVAIVAPALLAQGEEKESPATAKVDPYQLPSLPYGYQELEPHIDAQTMELHHTKHHAAYIKGLVEAEQALEKARQAGDFSLVQHWSKKLAFNGGGHALHTLFWIV
jgi:superoxide dismutase, Fe-Mn family